MKLTSSAFENNNVVPSKFTCDGENINPELLVSDIPPGTRSFVLIFDDPDAPGGTWVHWTLWNISPNNNEIVENSIPKGAVQGMTSFGSRGYGGPCPPSGKHRYFFKIYALNTELSLSSESKKEDLEKSMENHVIESAELVGLYSRK